MYTALYWTIALSLSGATAIVAHKRKCKSLVAISCLGLYLGWTIIGGIVALLWSVYGETESSEPSLSLQPGRAPNKEP